MKIERIRIDAFGHFQSWDVTLAPGMNVLCGPNEAGKTTLLAFIRSILFGFERRNIPQRYEPATGLFGGELHLATRLGRLVVRRVAGRRPEGQLSIRTFDGDPITEADFTQELGGISRELHRSVFAFGLGELASFKALAAEGSVSQALATAAMQGARRLPEAVEALTKSSQELYAPRAPTRELNKLLKELTSVQDSLKALGDRPAAYFLQLEELTALEAELSQASGESATAAARARDLDRLAQTLTELSALGCAEAELGTLPSFEGFPENAVDQAEALARRLEEGRREQHACDDELQRIERALEELSKPNSVLEHEGDVRTALDAFGARAEWLRSLPAREAALAVKRRQLNVSLSQLGLSSSPELWLRFDWGAAEKGTLLTFRDRLAEAARARRDHEERVRIAVLERDRCQANVSALENDRARLPQAEIATLRARKVAIDRIEPLRQELTRTERSLLESRTVLNSAALQSAPEPRLAFPFLWALAVVTAFFALAAVVQIRWGANLGVPSALVDAAVGAVLFGVQRRVAKSHRRTLDLFRTREEERVASRSRLLEQIRIAERELGKLQADLRNAGAEAEVFLNAPLEDLRRALYVLEEELEGARRRLDVESALGVARRSLGDAERVLLRATSEYELAETAASDLIAALNAWLSKRAFPEGQTPERAVELWGEAAHAQQRWNELEVEAKGLSEERAEASTIQASLVQAAAAVGLQTSSWEHAAASLTRALEEACQARARADRLGEQQRSMRLAQDRCTRVLAETTAALSVLLEKTGCESPAQVAPRSALAARARELRREAQTLRARVEGAAQCAESEVRRRVAQAGGPEGVQALKEEWETKAAGLRTQCAELAERRGALRTRLEEFETDVQAQRLRVAEEALRLRIAQLSNRYAVDRLALSLLGFARRRHQELHQPRLLQRASHFFQTLTAGRYVRILPSSELPDELSVRSVDGSIWSAEQLSQGTREQLFLAFRLAMIEDIGRARTPLPVVVDDVLVNFDPPRTRAAIAALGGLAKTHQVLAFTCQPATAAVWVESGATQLILSSERSISTPAEAG